MALTRNQKHKKKELVTWKKQIKDIYGNKKKKERKCRQEYKIRHVLGVPVDRSKRMREKQYLKNQ